MKKQLKNFVVFLSFTLLLSSCERESLEIDSQKHEETNIISFRQFLKKTNSTDFQYTIKNKSFQSKSAIDFLSFTVDTTVVKQLSLPDMETTFTLRVIPSPQNEDENIFYNIVFYKLSDTYSWSVIELEKSEITQEFVMVNEIINETTNNGLLNLRSSIVWGTMTSFHCTKTGPCAAGVCDLCRLCVSTTTTMHVVNLSAPVAQFEIAAPNSGATGGNGGINLHNNFKASLSTSQLQLYENGLDFFTKSNINNFLFLNAYSVESQIYVGKLLDYLNTNNNSPEAVEEINTILDLLDDGKIDGQDVVFAPDLPITNMTEYLSIFNTSQPAVITLSADQPRTGSHAPFNSLNINSKAGHAILTIKQGTKVRSLGFYPENTAASIMPNTVTLDPTDFLSVPSSFGNDENHDFDVSISTPITAAQLLSTINNIKSLFQSNAFYNIKTSNCANFAITIFNSNTSVTIPSCESPRIYWSGQTPATLGEVIKSMNLPSGSTKNTTGGTIPANNSN